MTFYLYIITKQKNTKQNKTNAERVKSGVGMELKQNVFIAGIHIFITFVQPEFRKCQIKMTNVDRGQKKVSNAFFSLGILLMSELMIISCAQVWLCTLVKYVICLSVSVSRFNTFACRQQHDPPKHTHNTNLNDSPESNVYHFGIYF